MFVSDVKSFQQTNSPISGVDGTLDNWTGLLAWNFELN